MWRNLKINTDRPADLRHPVAQHGFFKFAAQAFYDENDKMLYCGLKHDSIISGSGDYHKDESEETSPRTKWPEQNWGFAAGFRMARIPFDTKDNTVYLQWHY